MSEIKTDILIVGGGPNGLLAANYAAKTETDTLLVDKKDKLQDTSLCAGFISEGTLERLNVGDEPVLNTVKGGIIFPPDGTRFTMSSDNQRAYVLDRKLLNIKLKNRAMDKGVRIRTSTRATDFDHERNLAWLKSLKTKERSPVLSKAIIGADGPYSEVRKSLSLPPPEKFLFGIQSSISCRIKNKSYVEVHFGNKISPDFFGWVIPLDKNHARIGLATGQKSKLKSLFSELLKRKGVSGKVDFQTGIIPLGVLDKTGKQSTILLGDAAGQVKPATGGGLSPGSLCAKDAGLLASEFVRDRTDPSNLSKKYKNICTDKVEARLKKEMRLHRLLSTVEDDQLSTLLHILEEPKIRNMLTERGNLDNIYLSIKKLLKERKSLLPLFDVFSSGVKEFLIHTFDDLF